MLTLLVASGVEGHDGKLLKQHHGGDEVGIRLNQLGTVGMTGQGDQASLKVFLDCHRTDGYRTSWRCGEVLPQRGMAMIEQRQVIGVEEVLEHGSSYS